MTDKTYGVGESKRFAEEETREDIDSHTLHILFFVVKCNYGKRREKKQREKQRVG